MVMNDARGFTLLETALAWLLGGGLLIILLQHQTHALQYQGLSGRQAQITLLRFDCQRALAMHNATYRDALILRVAATLPGAQLHCAPSITPIRPRSSLDQHQPPS